MTRVPLPRQAKGLTQLPPVETSTDRPLPPPTVHRPQGTSDLLAVNWKHTCRDPQDEGAPPPPPIITGLPPPPPAGSDSASRNEEVPFQQELLELGTFSGTRVSSGQQGTARGTCRCESREGHRGPRLQVGTPQGHSWRQRASLPEACGQQNPLFPPAHCLNPAFDLRPKSPVGGREPQESPER